MGVSHSTAPLEVREKLHIAEDAIPELLLGLKQAGVEEAVVLSTCNRTEIYAGGASLEEAVRAVNETLEKNLGITRDWLHTYSYAFSFEDAYRHLFLVASGLDSMVVGEPQILGQVKDAYKIAALSKATGQLFDKVFNRAFQTAKRVRTETKIGYNPVSISSMAVELSRKIFGEFGQKKILVIGAGEMCEIALKQFKKEGVQEVYITNRTLQKAQLLAEEIVGTPFPFEDIPELLLKVDMVLSSTGADRPIIDKDLVVTVMKRRKHKPLFFIDIAVPRDIEPAINNIENVYLYDIDDLKSLSQAHLSNRLQEAERAHAIVEEEAGKFEAWLKQLELSPVITQVLDKLEKVRAGEVKKATQRLKSADKETLRQMELLSKAIVNKIAHPHIMMIKKNGSPLVLDVLKDLFQFEEEDEKEVDAGDKGE
ncbi:MAG TPA: glutamyl-tRNA reductase [Syntrophorhabdales bacterium]|nr:glutamyl-tRNA reductase [Syntrophorhabdales bacterium]